MLQICKKFCESRPRSFVLLLAVKDFNEVNGGCVLEFGIPAPADVVASGSQSISFTSCFVVTDSRITSIMAGKRIRK